LLNAIADAVIYSSNSVLSSECEQFLLKDDAILESTMLIHLYNN